MPYTTEDFLTMSFFFQGRGERSYDIFSRLLKERIICLNGPVSIPSPHPFVYLTTVFLFFIG